MYFVRSSPEDRLQPRLDSMVHRTPGDVLDSNQPVLFDVASGGRRSSTTRSSRPVPDLLRRMARRRARSRSHTTSAAYQVYRVIEVDAETGATRAVISEEVPTFFNYRTIRPNSRDSGKKFRYDLDDGREILWMSERDGWNPLYMYDGVAGRVKHRITKGEWVVRAIDSVDVANRRIRFQASGMFPDQDPYVVHCYSIGFDGSNLVAYTEADGNHTLTWSPDRTYSIDRYSRVDLPTVMEPRRARDRRVLAQLEAGHMSAQLAAGWQPPEVFVARGRDGATDIRGVIVRPTNFEPSRTYAVIG